MIITRCISDVNFTLDRLYLAAAGSCCNTPPDEQITYDTSN
jgi:hypothetical protein